MAMPKEATPPPAGLVDGAARWDHVPVSDSNHIPRASATMEPTLIAVSADCTRPTTLTDRQLIAAKARIVPTAVNCSVPKRHVIVWPSREKRLSAHTVVRGTMAEKNVAAPTPRMATEPAPPATKIIHP